MTQTVETSPQGLTGNTATWRAPLNRLEYSSLLVHDIEESVAWYTKALDLQVIDKNDKAALLTVGGDNKVDLALTLDLGRGHGLDSYSFGVESADRLDELAAIFAERGTPIERIDVGLPGLDGGIRIASPNGAAFQIVASADRATGKQNLGRNDGVAPVDTDHVTLMTTDVRGYAQWLHDTFGFETSDAVALPGGDVWVAAWTHITTQHHDVALHATPDDAMKLHHFAFLAHDLNHMGEIADRVCSVDQRRAEWGIGKHGGLGANNFLYVKDPSGNRIEINSGMADNPYERPTDIYPAEAAGDFISVWNYMPPPPGFNEGS